MDWLIWSHKKTKKKIGKYPGQILEVSGQLALSLTTQYDDTAAVIGSNRVYASIQQLGGATGKNKKTTIPARLYLKLIDDDLKEIIDIIQIYLQWILCFCYKVEFYIFAKFS